MGVLSEEYNTVDNPNLGAFIIWRFVKGYSISNKEGVPLPLIFIVLSTIYNPDILNEIQSTREESGLRQFTNKMSGKSNPKKDLLLQIYGESNSEYMKFLTYNSIRIAIYLRFIELDYTTAFLKVKNNKNRTAEPPNIIKMGKAAEKLGVWCSRHTLYEISNILKVRF
ncbi:three component ABC system middle component [Lysinibacillus sp. NPDC097162]|uniref:three component ABC system middle component n=1 Tax=Lysinibacillus sp. NPDC097162 TaxID=3364140 RepID=UPI003825E6F6